MESDRQRLKTALVDIIITADENSHPIHYKVREVIHRGRELIGQLNAAEDEAWRKGKYPVKVRRGKSLFRAYKHDPE